MNYKIEENKVTAFFEIIDELEKLLTERISDLSGVEGGMQARHAYIFYRKMLWEAKLFIKKNIEPLEE